MKNLIFTIMICLTSIHALAHTNVCDLWANMPDSIIPYFNSGIRNEMLDMYKSKNNTKSKNLLNGSCWIDSISDNLMNLHINESTQLQIATYQCADSAQIICMIKTYNISAPESEITFYSLEWSKISNRLETTETGNTNQIIRTFTQHPNTMEEQKYNEIIKCIEPIMFTATINKNLEIEIAIAGTFLTKQEYDDFETIKKKKCFKWNGEIFK